MMPRSHQRALFCLLLSGTLMSARGEVVLANFSAANPVKIMAVGDSITDDCVFNGAWRQYLQPLLDTSGYPSLSWAGWSPCPPGVLPKRTMKGIAEPLLPRPA